MIPKQSICDERVLQFVVMHSLDIDSAVYMAALRVCARGPLEIGLDPSSCEMVLAVRGKAYPSLEKLSIQCGDCVIAAKFLSLCGVAITRSVVDL